MQFTLKTDEPDRKVYEASVPASQLETKVDEIMTEAQAQIQLPGFRPGKAPLNLIRRKLGKRLIDGVKEELEKDALESMRDMAVPFAGRPEVVVDGEDLTQAWTVTVSVSPPASITEFPELSGLAVDVEAISVTDDDVMDAMREEQREKADLQEIDEGASQSGDFLTISYGYYAMDRNSSSARTERLDSRDFDAHKQGNVPWMQMIATQTLGLEPGDSVDLDVESIPPEWGDEGLAGKSGKFMIDVVKIERPILDDLDDDVAQDLEYDDLANWKEKTREQLQRDVDRANESRQMEAVVTAIRKEATFLIPEPAFDEEMMNMAMRDHSERDSDDADEQMKQVMDSYLFYRQMYQFEQEQGAKEGQAGSERRMQSLLRDAIERRLVMRRLFEDHGGEPSIDELKEEYLGNIRRQMALQGQSADEDLEERLVDAFMESDEQMDAVRDVLRSKKAILHALETMNTSTTTKSIAETRAASRA